MTAVKVDLRVPSASGINVPLNASVRWTPTARRALDGYVVLPRAFTMRLEGGVADVVVAPTEVDWCWRVDEMINGRTVHSRFVAVPVSAFTLFYSELADLDPLTFEPATADVPAWEAAVSEIRGYRDEVLANIGDTGGTSAALVTHIEDTNPHPAAVSGRDFVALFQNGLI